MFLIVRHKIIRPAGQRLGHDPGIGRIIHDRSGVRLLLLRGRRPDLHLRPVQQAGQQREQIRRLAPKHLIGLL